MIPKTISPGLADDVFFVDVEDESATSGTKAFNPLQPRDPHTGEWIKVPGSGVSDLAEFAATPELEWSGRRSDGTYAARSGDDRYTIRPTGSRIREGGWEVRRTGPDAPSGEKVGYGSATLKAAKKEAARDAARRATQPPLAKFETASGWDTSADDAVESARKAHGIPQARRYEVSVNGMVMQGESRDFPSAVDAVVRAHDAGSTDVKVMVKRGTSMTQEPSAEDHAAILEAATAVIARQSAKDQVDLPQSNIQMMAEMMAATTTHHLTPKPTISPEVQKAVTDNASATKFVKDKTGIDLKFGDFKGNKGFWQEISQSVLDTTKKFPVLTQGGKYGKLTRIGLDSELPQPHSDIQELDLASDPNSWAATSFDVSRSHAMGVHVAIPKDYPKPGADAWITLFEHPGDADALLPVTEGSEMDGAYKQGMASQPTRWVYGRLMHEMGHAVAEMSGQANAEQDDRSLDDHHGVNPTDMHYQGQTVRWLEQSGLTPEMVAKFSAYAVPSPAETWAEIFVTLNAPHGMDGLDPRVKTKLLHLQQIANDWAAFHKVPGGRIL